MAATFAKVLEGTRLPARIGDVWLRYEPSMMVGETRARLRAVTPTIAWSLGLAASLLGITLIAVRAPDVGVVVVSLLAAAAYAAAAWLRRLDRRRRAFVANFATSTLRLDFVTAIAGFPRTMLVPFSRVSAVDLQTVDDSSCCLTVDFAPALVSSERLREVLVAYISQAEVPMAERLRDLLRNALVAEETRDESKAALGPAPAMSDLSTFEP